jgi:hypothetical protein
MNTVYLSALCAAALLASAAAPAATPEGKALYDQTRAAAAAAYKAEKAQCHSVAGNARDVCEAEAKARFVRADEDATAQYRNTLDANTRARMKISAANYDLDRAKCGALGGNDKDVCIQQAKATRVAAEADAKADQKAFEARQDARDDKRTAEYKVALEKCDAFAGAVKDNCVSTAKSQYGK